ncbi:MAG: ABC transporter ATP-binding protein [Coxiellaceae bacterium]|nr:ABC transporter ATP-binding protein [Coxiellaceae bacterium]
MFNDIKKIKYLLSKKERNSSIVLFIFMCFQGILDVIGIGFILPFIAIASSPSSIHSHKILSKAYHVLGFSTDRGFLIFFGFVVVAVLILGSLYSSLVSYAAIKTSCLREHSLSVRLFGGYLKQKYSYFLHKNTSDISKNIVVELRAFIKGVYLPLHVLFSKLISIIFIVTLLFIARPYVSLAIVAFFIVVYFLVSFVTKRKLARISSAVIKTNRDLGRQLSETFGGIKLIKLYGNESFFNGLFSVPAKAYPELTATSMTIGMVPKYIMESFTYGGLVLLILYFIIFQGGFLKAMPVLTLFAFASYRVMPSIQAIFIALASVRSNIKSLDLIYNEFRELSQTAEDLGSNPAACHTSIDDLSFEDRFSLNNIKFSYGLNQNNVLKNINMAVKKNTVVGLVGKTGAGKSTLVDIMLGLLTPSGGYLSVDNKPLKLSDMSSWQRKLSYVPQYIYLSDASIIENIAYGMDAKLIDVRKVNYVANLAGIHDFIVTELPDGYETEVGERGVRLSGGQRQRIGIARALYRDPEVLVLDEATSALDNTTEKQIMDSVFEISKNITVIIIAHRISTLQRCNTIYEIKNGNIHEVFYDGEYDRIISEPATSEKC